MQINATLGKMDAYLKRLRELMLKKIEEKNFTIAEFADKCNVSQREISRIKNGEAKNIRFDVFVKICENSGIPYIDIFEYQPQNLTKDNLMSKYILTDGKITYKLKKLNFERD